MTDYKVVGLWRHPVASRAARRIAETANAYAREGWRVAALFTQGVVKTAMLLDRVAEQAHFEYTVISCERYGFAVDNAKSAVEALNRQEEKGWRIRAVLDGISTGMTNYLLLERPAEMYHEDKPTHEE